MAIVFELQILQLKDFCKTYQLMGLKPKNKSHANFYECCDLTEKSISNIMIMKEYFAIFAIIRAYIECSAMENRGLRHVVEEAVWILNSAITSTENALMSSFEAIGGSTGASSFGSLSSRKWSLSSSFPSVKSSSSLLQKPRYVIHATMMYIMDIFLRQFTTFIKVRLAFAFRLQTL